MANLSSPTQLFESTIGDQTTGLVFRTITVPAASFSGRDWRKPRRLQRKLGFESARPLFRAGFIVREIQSLLERDNPSAKTKSSKDFAEWLALEPLVPFQESPWDLKSLGSLVVKASGAGIGAYAGIVAFEGHPMILIAVPAGMIICGAAAGVAKALQKGLYKRVLSMMGVPAKARTARRKARRKTKSSVTVQTEQDKKFA